MIKVNKTQTMLYLFDSLNIRGSEITILPDAIQLNLNYQQLMYAINATEADLQYIYGDSDEWKELTGLTPNKFQQ